MTWKKLTASLKCPVNDVIEIPNHRQRSSTNNEGQQYNISVIQQFARSNNSMQIPRHMHVSSDCWNQYNDKTNYQLPTTNNSSCNNKEHATKVKYHCWVDWTSKRKSLSLDPIYYSKKTVFGKNYSFTWSKLNRFIIINKNYTFTTFPS